LREQSLIGGEWCDNASGNRISVTNPAKGVTVGSVPDMSFEEAGRTVPSPWPDRRIVTLKEPVGVCAIITPWNFPAAMITCKIAPALAAGCAVVIKPSELTPFTALALASLAVQAGIPAGVINVVTGMPTDIGAALIQSTTVRKLSFNGSTRVGTLLMAQCAPTIKKLSLELGGNAPFIVFDDADLDAAVKGCVASKFRNGGQTCVCSNYILVQAGIYDAFAEKLAAQVNAMRVGAGDAESTVIGPMINEDAVAKIDIHVQDALSKGVQIVGGRPVTPEGATYVAPVILKQTTAQMRLASEETFGPVAPLFRFNTEQEAITLANNTPYGLAAYFYTSDHARAWRVGEALEAGLVGLNVGVMACDVAPFGGVKQSGLGRKGGTEGIEDFLETKAFHMGGFRYCLAAFSDAKPVSTFAESALANHIFETVICPNGRQEPWLPCIHGDCGPRHARQRVFILAQNHVSQHNTHLVRHLCPMA
jgi:succinate-semialdehyde dehydrogenase/glutarate-semialdehyde dehydrogenase